MAALKPEIIRDTIELINLYKKNPAFRERFDLAVERNVNATFKLRPLKLYFEVLASSSPKYKDEYAQVSRLVRHDTEGIIKNTLMGVTVKDLQNLYFNADKAEDKVNSTSYPEAEIEKINKIEDTATTPDQKQAEHQKRLDETNYLKPAEKIPVMEKAEEIKTAEATEEKPTPGASPEYKKSYQPASEEEKARLEAALNQPRREIPISVLVGPGGEPIRNIRPEPVISKPELEAPEEERPTKGAPSIPKTPSFRTVTRTREFISSPTTFIRNIFRRGGVERIGARVAAGRAATTAISRTAIKVGASTVAKAGAGIIARLGISTVLSTVFGIATGGIGLIIGIAVTLITTIVTTFSKQIKDFFKLILWSAAGVLLFMVFMFFSNWGMKMNSLLPPYKIAFAEPAPSISPSPSVSPSPSPSITPTPGANTATCPLQNSGGISCGSYGSNYSGCPGGHCSNSYNAGLPPANQCSPSDSRLPHSIDVAASAGTLVYLPSIDGQSIIWTFIGSNSVAGEAGGGLRLMFTARVGNNDWLLYLTHVSFSSTQLNINSSYQSGSAVATVSSNQVHINIGRKTPSDADTVWIDPESLGMCI